MQKKKESKDESNHIGITEWCMTLRALSVPALKALGNALLTESVTAPLKYTRAITLTTHTAFNELPVERTQIFVHHCAVCLSRATSKKSSTGYFEFVNLIIFRRQKTLVLWPQGHSALRSTTATTSSRRFLPPGLAWTCR